MPPKKVVREAAPTRQSKRIRKAHNEDGDDASPLKVLTHERQKRRQVSSTKKAASQASVSTVNGATDAASSSEVDAQASPTSDRSSQSQPKNSHNVFDLAESEESREENRNSRPSNNFHRQCPRTKLNTIEVNQVADSNFRKSSIDKSQLDIGSQGREWIQMHEQTVASPLKGRTSSVRKKRNASAVDDSEEANDERPSKIRKSAAPTSLDPRPNPSQAVTPARRRPIDRPAQSARAPRDLTSAGSDPDIEQALFNVIDRNTEFGKHHSVQQEIRLRRQRLLRKRSLAAERILSGITETATPESEVDQASTQKPSTSESTTQEPEAKPAEQSTTSSESLQPQTPSRSSWGIGSVLNRVGSAIHSWMRASPTQQQPQGPTQTAPIERHNGEAVSGTADNDLETPTAKKQPQELSQNATPSNKPAPNGTSEEDDADEEEEEDDIQMPATPTPSTTSTNISTNPRGKKMPRVATPGRTRVGYQERVRKIQEKKRKDEAAEAAQRKAEQESQSMRAEEESLRMKKYFMEHPVPQSDIKEVLRKREQGLQVGFKRKFRVDDLSEIPRPKNGDFGVLDYIEEDSDGEEYCYIDEYGFLSKRGAHDVINTDECTRPAATKKVRFAENLETGPTPSKPTWSTGPLTPHRSGSLNDVTPSLTSAMKTRPHQSLTSGDPHHAQPYLGTIFARSLDEMDAETNVFDLTKSLSGGLATKEAQSNAIAYGQRYKVWTGPKVIPQAGSFTVPDDSDSDDESEVGAGDTDSQAESNRAVTPERQTAADSASDLNANPTTPSTPSNLTATASGVVSSTQVGGNDQNALARARSQAEKYKPKTPSALRASSRLSSSPVGNKTLPAPKDAATEKFQPNIFASAAAANTRSNTFSSEKTPPPTEAEEFTTSPSSPSSLEDEHHTAGPEPFQKGINLPKSSIFSNLDEQIVFEFPKGKPAPWANLVTPEMTAALDAWFLHPATEEDRKAMEKECNDAWKAATDRHQREVNRGK